MAQPWEMDPIVGAAANPVSGAGGIDPETGRLRVNITRDPWEDDPIVTTPDPSTREPTFLGSLSRAGGLTARNALNAVGGAADLVTLPATSLMRLIGVEPTNYRDLSNQGADALGLPSPEVDSERLSGMIAEGAFSGAGVGAAARGIVPLAQGASRTVLSAIGATPVADTVATASGAGASELARQSGVGPAGQIVAGLAGGVGGAATVMGAPAAARRITQSTEMSDLMKAFSRQQVIPMADQTGGTASRVASAVSRSTLGGIPLAKAAEKSIESARAARDRIAASMGRVTDDTGAGQAAQRGANTFIQTSAAKGGKLYEAIPIKPDRPAALSSTRKALADLNAGLKSNTELSEMLADSRLMGFQSAIEGRTQDVPIGILDADGNPITRAVQKGGGLSWQDLKQFRTYIGEKAGAPSLQSDTSQDALKRLYAALSEDMKATATAEGPDALRAFNRANAYWAGRQKRIEDTLTAILGPEYNKNPEAAFANIERWAREGGDSARLARLMRSLPDDEAATVRATLFSRMGNAPAGRQTADQNVFSPADFATQWAKLDPRAKSVMFPGEKYRQSLDDIARIADAMKRSGEFANVSRTALAGNGVGLATMGLMGSPLAAGGIASSQLAFGSLLASPRFARWLASAPKKPVGPATLAHINRLGAIAATEPTIANEVLMLQERLAQAFTQTPLRAAAEEEEQQ